MLMEHKGYEIKQGKYISFKPLSREHFSRGYKLGNEYSFMNINNRVEGKNLSQDLKNLEQYMQKKQEFIPYPKVKTGSFKALCLHYMYLLGQVKKNQAPDETAHVLKDDLLRFEKMTMTFNFITDKQLKTVEQVEEHKNKCYQEINQLKTKKSELLVEKEKYKLAYSALADLRIYEKPYQLFVDGYNEMQDEHDKYKIALNTLKSIDHETMENISVLENNKSNIEDLLAKNGDKIRKLRQDIRSCNTALELNSHIEKRLKELSVQKREDHEESRMTAKKAARNLLER